MPFFSASDFETLFDSDLGLGTAGTFTTLSGSPAPYSVAAVIDDDADVVDENSQTIFKSSTITFLTSQLTNDPVRGDTWLATDSGISYKMERLFVDDGHVQTWEVTK